MTDQIRLSQTNTETLLLCTLRYSMGRQTYMPGEFQDIFQSVEDSLSPRCISQTIDEIRYELRKCEEAGKFLGAEFDHRDWKKFADRLATKFKAVYKNVTGL